MSVENTVRLDVLTLVQPVYLSANLSAHRPGRLDQVVILGGGRWARVLAGVMCDMLPENIPLMVCSPRGASALAIWAAERGFENRVSVMQQWPDSFATGCTAVIVANAARDHTNAARWALERGASVLVEKPMAVSLQEAQDLVDHACRCGGLLTAAHVLRFARYLNNFARMLPPWNEIRSVTIEWMDPAREQRYGEAKHYDPSVPVYIDCLPHAVSVLQSIFGVLPETAGLPMVEAGGARVTLPLLLGDRSCLVILQRNGPQRLRRVTVEAARGSLTLDFSLEPGVITLGAKEFCGDSRWDTAPSPLVSMLGAFLAAAARGEVDSRLNHDTALTACAISGAVTPAYQAAVLPWLMEQLLSALGPDADAEYALAELLQADGRLAANELTMRAIRLRQRLRDAPPAPEGAVPAVDYLRRVAAEEIAPPPPGK